jgi:hypothetical protein
MEGEEEIRVKENTKSKDKDKEKGGGGGGKKRRSRTKSNTKVYVVHHYNTLTTTKKIILGSCIRWNIKKISEAYRRITSAYLTTLELES